MKFNYVNNYWLKNASEEELRDTIQKLDLLHIDVVNSISSRFLLNLSHREHGWYIQNDD